MLIRVADVCLRADDTVLIAALARALAEIEARAAREGKAASRTRTELLRLAAWRASRSSLDGVLLSPVTGLPERAAAVAACYWTTAATRWRTRATRTS
jgi:carboxylate-amine ligase